VYGTLLTFSLFNYCFAFCR